MLSLLILYEVEVLQCADHIFNLDGSHFTKLLQTYGALIVLQHLQTQNPESLYHCQVSAQHKVSLLSFSSLLSLANSHRCCND